MKTIRRWRRTLFGFTTTEDAVVLPPTLGYVSIFWVFALPVCVIAGIYFRQPIFIVWPVLLTVHTVAADVRHRRTFEMAYRSGRKIGRAGMVTELLARWVDEDVSPNQWLVENALYSSLDGKDFVPPAHHPPST